MSNKASQLSLAGKRVSTRGFFSDYFFRTSILTLFAALLVIPSSGCATGRLRIPRLGIGDALLEKYRDTVWARRAFNLRYANCNIPYSSHFQNGFIAGYCQKCNGGDGYVPPLPPEEYRGYEFQSADGAQCVKAWFDGFPAGVAAAQKDRAGEFHDIYTSKMINAAITQDKAKHVLPDDVPVLKGSVKAAKKLSTAEIAAPPTPSPIYRQARLSPLSPTPVNTLSPSYVAPPTKSPNPILNPNSITPEDLTPAPQIKKSGPAAMKRASTRFNIDPAVAVTQPLVAPVIRLAKPKIEPVVAAELPPIVRGSIANAEKSIGNQRSGFQANVTPVISTADAAVNQAPLPISVGKPSWERASTIRR